MQFLVFVFLYVAFFLYLSVCLMCYGACGLIQINVCMYAFYQLVRSVVTLNTSVTEKNQKCNQDYCIKTHEHCILLVAIP